MHDVGTCCLAEITNADRLAGQSPPRRTNLSIAGLFRASMARHELGNSPDGAKSLQATATSNNSNGRQSINIGDDIDHSRTLRGQRLSERRGKSGRLLHADAERAHVLCDAREIGLAEGP
jgi:hypothetical protein